MKLKISNNSPVILGFSLICLVALVLDSLTQGFSNAAFFSVYRFSLSDPLGYLRLFTHVFGHAGVSHFIGNIMLLLVIGPLLEEKYGSGTILITIAATAFVTGVVHCILFSSALLGASGVVFAFIVLASFTDVRNGEIPVTFILVLILYLGEQVYDGIFLKDNVSNLTHIIGGLVGAAVGVLANYKDDDHKGAASVL